MKEETKKPDLIEIIGKNLKVSRQDIENPHKKQDDITVIYPSDNEEEEDENTLAKSIVDEIIDETENQEFDSSTAKSFPTV